MYVAHHQLTNFSFQTHLNPSFLVFLTFTTSIDVAFLLLLDMSWNTNKKTVVGIYGTSLDCGFKPKEKTCTILYVLVTNRLNLTHSSPRLYRSWDYVLCLMTTYYVHAVMRVLQTTNPDNPFSQSVPQVFQLIW